MSERNIPYGRQDISPQDIDAVVSVLQSDWLTQGPSVPAFEEAVAAWCGVPYGVAVSNATAALHLACRALGLGPGGILWTVPNTFVASANCALYCGARVDFVDVDAGTFNLSVPALEAKLANAERDGCLPQVLVVVHFAGQPCDMKAVARLASRYGFSVVEDASHAVGAEYEGEKTGNCRYSDITVFSFHPVKILTTAEGGLLLTRKPELHERLALLRSHGITRNPGQMRNTPQGPWYYEQVDLGYNYRLTDLQAALGRSQLDRLPEFLARRRYLAERYGQRLAGLPLKGQQQLPETNSAWHLYPIRLDDGIDRGRVFQSLRQAGIGVNVHYIPVHTQPYYRDMGFAPGDYPAAEAYYAQAISLPMYFGLTDADQDFVVEQLGKGLAAHG